MHYLALTFSTLLSSQASGAHRAGSFLPGLGQLDQLYEVVQPQSNSGSTSSPTRVEDIRAGPLLEGDRPAGGLDANGFPPGRPPRICSILGVLHPDEALTTLLVRCGEVKPCPGQVPAVMGDA